VPEQPELPPAPIEEFAGDPSPVGPAHVREEAVAPWSPPTDPPPLAEEEGQPEPPPPTAAEPLATPIDVDPPLAPIPPDPPPAPIPADPPTAPSPADRPLAPIPVQPSPIPASRLPRPGAPRSLPARAAALLALAGVIAAVWLVLHSLLGSGQPKTAATPAIVSVLIPEGKTRLQIAQIATADGLTGSYRAASKRSKLLAPTHYGAPRGTPDLEGFLFPATYELDAGASVGRLVNEQLLAFREKFGPRTTRRARELHVTPYQLLTVASMIEREAGTAHDRPLIAAVIYNRLHQGMPLGIDATIYYAVELQKNIATYTHELSETQLHIDSPYNTRTHTGLPPTPISNPGVASIEAAAHPAHASFLFYVAAADGCGEQRFSTTDAQFELDAAAYRAAVKKNGGRPPTCKKK
jgi:cell division protein YceG involved in septum cleavage